MSGTSNPAAPEQRQLAAGWMTTRPWLGVIFLLLIGILNYLDRVLPSILAEPIKEELVLSDTALGLINGIGFLVIYAVASLPIATLSDRGRYPLVVWSCLGIWSLMTAVGGLVATGWQLALTRSGVALGEAGGMPAAHTFITRHIPRSSRTSAFALFTMCLPLGTMAGFVVGGFVGQALGWRDTFLLMGVIGLILAFVAYLLFGNGTAAPHTPITGDAPKAAGIAYLLSKKSVFATLTGAAFIGMGGYTAMAFTPAFLMRSHGMSISEAGVAFGISGGIAGIVGLILIGRAADRLSLRDPRWLLGVNIVMIVVAAPLSFLAYSISNTAIAMVGLSVNLAIAMVYAAPVVATLHRLAPVHLRARASALLLLATAILGGIGPLATGAISDALYPQVGESSLGYGLLVVPFAYLAAAACFLIAVPFFRKEMEEEMEEITT